ncbi:hypothetical protein ACFSUM_15460, partial [Virgibacillus siamensis]
MDNRITFDALLEKNAWRFRCQTRKMDISRPDDDLFQEGLFAMWKPFESYQPDHDPLAIYFTCMIRKYLTDMLTGKLPAKKNESSLDATINGSHRHSAIPRHVHAPLTDGFHTPKRLYLMYRDC